MANRTVYPYGTDGQLPSSIGIVNDLSTGGADKALSAEMGKTLDANFIQSRIILETTSSTGWTQGNVSNGTIVYNYNNRFITKDLPSDSYEFIVQRDAPDTDYNLGVYGSADGTNYTALPGFTNGQSSVKTYERGSYTKVLLLLWDKPSEARAKEEIITISVKSRVSFIRNADIAERVFTQDGTVPSVGLFRQMASDVWTRTLTAQNGDFYWVQGGRNGQTGAYESNARAICTALMPVHKNQQLYIVPNPIDGENFFVAIYDDEKNYLGSHWSFGDCAKIQSLLTDEDGYISFVYYGSDLIYPTNETANALQVKVTGASGSVMVTDSYSNPVIRQDAPDPTVWDGEDGYYYLLATGNLSTATMWRSSNLYEWENTGDAPFTEETAEEVATAFGQSSTNTYFWAPHIFKVNPTTWNLYLTKPQGGLAILTSSHPTRGYVFSKFISKPSEAGEFIDAELGYDTDGKLWLFTGGSGSIYRRQMTADGLDWEEESSFERVAGLASSAEGNVNREKTFEGPYLYRRGGYWYLFCSSGQYATGNYKLRVLRSQSLSGAFVDSEGNAGLDGYADTVLISNNTLTGPGHNAPIFVDRHNQNWILYHSHWSGFDSSSWRGVCLDKVEWDENGWPFINDGKPSTKHDAPQM